MNAAHPALISGTIVLKGESLRRYDALAAALILQFQPRNSAESFLIQTMTAARWRLLRTWGIQTAGFEMEMAKTREKSGDAAGTGAVLAAVTFRSLADSSRVLTIQHRFEAAFERQYNQALAMLLKMREIPDSSPSSEPPLQLITETWDDKDTWDDEETSDDENKIEANLETEDSTSHE